MNARGHQPQGGIDSATSKPEMSVRAKRRRLLVLEVTQLLCVNNQRKRQFVVLLNEVDGTQTRSELQSRLD